MKTTADSWMLYSRQSSDCTIKCYIVFKILEFEIVHTRQEHVYITVKLKIG
jgi:hypothetical protein